MGPSTCVNFSRVNVAEKSFAWDGSTPTRTGYCTGTARYLKRPCAYLRGYNKMSGSSQPRIPPAAPHFYGRRKTGRDRTRVRGNSGPRRPMSCLSAPNTVAGPRERPPVHRTNHTPVRAVPKCDERPSGSISQENEEIPRGESHPIVRRRACPRSKFPVFPDRPGRWPERERGGD